VTGRRREGREAEELLEDRVGVGAEDDEAPPYREAPHQVQGPREEGLSPEGEEEFLGSHAPSGPGSQDNRRDA